MMRELLFRNLGLKLLSLLLAILLWFFISAKGVSEITIEVPIEYINIPAGYEILKKDRDTVRVSVFGSERVLRSIRPEDLRVYVDLKDARPGKGSYPIKKSNIKVPPALTISSVTPPKVNIVLDRTVSREVPVKPDLLGKPAPGRYISEITVRPERVEIEGPETVIRKVPSVRTEPIDVSGLREDVIEKVGLETDISEVRLTTDSVEVHITVKEGGGR